MLPALMLAATLALAAPQSAPTFEVASIKPSRPDRSGGPPYHGGPNSFSMQARLDHLIEQAYEVKYYQLAGGPSWLQSDWYDVIAKAGAEADTHQIRLMLQTLLADRFHLKLHRETRSMAGYTLTVDKNGPKLPAPRTDVPLDAKGAIQMGGGLWARGATLDQVANGLSLELQQPVLDQTRIEGHYDFRVRFQDGTDAEAVGSIFSAFREVGLKLTPGKVPVDVLVIDSAEKPSAN